MLRMRGQSLSETLRRMQGRGKGRGPQQHDGCCYKCGMYGRNGAECRSEDKGKGMGKDKAKRKTTWSPYQTPGEVDLGAQGEQDWGEGMDEVSGTLEDVCEVGTECGRFSKITKDSEAGECVAHPTWRLQYDAEKAKRRKWERAARL